MQHNWRGALVQRMFLLLALCLLAGWLSGQYG